MQILEHSVIRVLNASGATVGTGFIVGDHLAVTCAHVVQAAGSTCGQSLRILFSQEEGQEAQVLTVGWSPPAADDVAFLQVELLPAGIYPVVLGSAEHEYSDNASYTSFGFAKLAGYDSRKVRDTIHGVVPVSNQHKRRMLQLKGEEIDKGLSGSPVLDASTNRVIGMISEYKDNERTRFAWATTADTLATLNSSLQLWPETYGPQELKSYLQYLITTCQRLELPDRSAVELERIYVSLRADEMNATEWKAEHDLYLEQVEQITQMLVKEAHEAYDQYQASHALRKALVRHPRVFKLTARDWHKLFSSQGKRSLSLADVARDHSHVVILGDPGSGKSTMGKWLALQHARALFGGHPRVLVYADLVRPGTEVEDLLDLGEARLPILVRIADYAQARWSRGRDDTHLPLERFLGQHDHRQDRPSNLPSTVLQAIAWDFLAKGQALVILDGLDEVTDPGQRKKVMHEVKRFLRHPTSAISLSATSEQWSTNTLLLTSRIVGYQFDPLIELPHYTIEDMDESAITALYRAWMRHVPALDEVSAEEETRMLIDQLFHQAHTGVRALAGNPLLSTLLVQLYWSSPQHTFPASRVGLFEEITRLFYDQREGFWDRVGLPPLRLYRALAAVAYHIHAHEPTGFTDEGQVQDCLRRVLPDPEQVEAVLVAAREVSGFLVARGEGVYGFLHRSLQEYFVALYLADPYSDENQRQMIERLVTLSLDPTWREPVVLAVGRIGRSKHPENKRLGTLLSSLLDAPDPIGDVLPRREFLVAAACAECERLSGGIGKRTAEYLLARPLERNEQAVSPMLRERIREAFRTLQRCPAPGAAETEMVLCAAIIGSDSGRRYAAIDVMIATAWDTPALASALITAWKTYDGPAGAMLVALEGIAERHPACFAHLGLSMREGNAAWIWNQMEASEQWQAIVRVLYLPVLADVKAEQVNRDSSLTEQIMATFRQNDSEVALQLLRQQLGPLAAQPGSAQARDAALVLAALGETQWVEKCVMYVGTQKELLYPLLAALWFFLGRTHALDRALDRVFDRNLPGIVSNIEPDYDAFERFFANDHVLVRACDLVLAFSDSHSLFFKRGAGFALQPNFTRDLDRDLALARVHRPDRDLALACDFALDPARAYVNIQDVEQALHVAQIRWGDALRVAESLDMARKYVQVSKNFLSLRQPMATVWTMLTDLYDKQHLTTILQPPILLNRQDKVTLEILEQLLKDLTSLDDTKREHARQLLERERPASMLGMACIERMAVLAQEHASHPQIGIQLLWALGYITYDMPNWIEKWVVQAHDAEQETLACTLLAHIISVTPEVFLTLLQVLPEASIEAKHAILHSLDWMIRLEQIPEQFYPSLLEQLTTWLYEERTSVVRRTIITALGYWHDQHTADAVAATLLRLLASNTALQLQEQESLFLSLARLASCHRAMIGQVHAVLTSNSNDYAATVALVRLIVVQVVYDEEEWPSDHAGEGIVKRVKSVIADPAACLQALLQAGADNDSWNHYYHHQLVLAIQHYVEEVPDLLPLLITYLKQAQSQQDWPERRIALAGIAACAEVMPTKLQQVAHGELEVLLVQEAIGEDYDCRRFALTGLSYLRTITPAVVPALLAGCQDIEIVQRDAVTAAGRFQEIQGDILSKLVPWLTGESVSTAYGVAQTLGALGTSIAGQAAQLHGQIIEALIQAIKSPQSQRKVDITDIEEETLEDVLYRVLLQVAGWVA